MYFDLHLHPALKSFLTDTEEAKRDDCWTTYRNCVDFAVGNIIDSQASLRQLDRGETTTAIAAIYSLENGLDDIFLINRISPIISHLDRGMVKDIRQRDYYQRFLEKVVHLENSLVPRDGAKPYKILSSAGELDTAGNNLILAIEGAHILQTTDDEDPLVKLNELKNFRHKIFYLTLCHFARNPLCTQAFAMKLVKPDKVPNFLPAGTGLTAEGKSVIKRAYAHDDTGKRILIDVKHMSLSGRQQFYSWKNGDAAMKDLPIIASHVGVTGVSWAATSRKRHYKEVHYLPSLGQWAVEYHRPLGLRLGNLKSYFTPTTINLFDEDIREIVASKGMIGIMLDQRQLGVSKKPFEYFDRDDFDRLASEPGEDRRSGPAEEKIFASKGDEEDYIDSLTFKGYRELFSPPDLNPVDFVSDMSGKVTDLFKKEDAEGDGPSTYRSRTTHTPYKARRLSRKRKRHLLHLCNNLLHIADVAGAEAWSHVCIGSDFDGLVDAVNNCRNVTEYRDLEEHLYDILMELVDNGGPGFRERYHLGDIRWQLRNFLYENGIRFVRANF